VCTLKTNWEHLSRKLGVLKSDGSEFISGNNSAEAIEEILGDEWLQDTLDTFIDGRLGNELAIKTLRFIRSERVAKMAYKIFDDNRNTNERKARLAIWALSDIRMPICLDYVEEFIKDPRYENIAIAVLRNLVFENVHFFEEARLNRIFDAIHIDFQEDIKTLREYTKQEFCK
jgi:hypothetical protein